PRRRHLAQPTLRRSAVQRAAEVDEAPPVREAEGPGRRRDVGETEVEAQAPGGADRPAEAREGLAYRLRRRRPRDRLVAPHLEVDSVVRARGDPSIHTAAAPRP